MLLNNFLLYWFSANKTSYLFTHSFILKLIQHLCTIAILSSSAPYLFARLTHSIILFRNIEIAFPSCTMSEKQLIVHKQKRALNLEGQHQMVLQFPHHLYHLSLLRRLRKRKVVVRKITPTSTVNIVHPARIECGWWYSVRRNKGIRYAVDEGEPRSSEIPFIIVTLMKLLSGCFDHHRSQIIVWVSTLCSSCHGHERDDPQSRFAKSQHLAPYDHTVLYNAEHDRRGRFSLQSSVDFKRLNLPWYVEVKS